ncbi:hypothetical protein M501DRAFT_1000848 [Patellaria atrata CBS 101060]|uniref:Uncharacterized protein n=1 Tax=Patellaria atrata CBS 101060 TaxID=1346257 RepID=A0A9P4SGV9_9PEZI|nr:hypothetical protein M501DRAFT_1000848 [Patellaria atrata CBS 101060]
MEEKRTLLHHGVFPPSPQGVSNPRRVSTLPRPCCPGSTQSPSASNHPQRLFQIQGRQDVLGPKPISTSAPPSTVPFYEPRATDALGTKVIPAHPSGIVSGRQSGTESHSPHPQGTSIHGTFLHTKDDRHPKAPPPILRRHQPSTAPRSHLGRHNFLGSSPCPQAHLRPRCLSTHPGRPSPWGPM